MCKVGATVFDFSFSFLFLLFFFFETGSYCVAQAEFEFIILLPQLPRTGIIGVNYHIQTHSYI
jgi:hypothetical protein